MSPPDHPSQTAVSKYKTIASIFVLALAGYLIAVPASPPKHQSSTATSTATYTSTATNTATPVSGQWPVTVGADPAWLAFSVDAVTYYTPTTFNWDVNSQHTISTVSPQAGGRFESRFRFNNWSDGTSTPTVTPTLTGTASPRPTEPPQTYANFAPICTTAGSPADLYPSTITVSGVTNSLGNLRVLLYGVTHQVPDDLDVLLVAPSGEKFILMADAGGTTPIGQPGIDLTFSDSAGQILPDSMAAVTGLYEPTSWEAGQANFPSPAPPGPYNQPGSEIGGTGTSTMSGTFGGINPNGVWSLYVRDDGGSLDGTGGTAGCVDRGWQLQFLPLVSASISGRVTNANGQGIRGARVVITSTWLPEPLVATTGSFGYYSFEGLEPYLTYVATVSSGRYMFSTPSRVISLTQNVTDADFIADP